MAVVAIIVVLASFGRGLLTRATTLGAAASARLPGMLTTSAPWPNNTARLADRLQILGLPGVGILEHIHVFVAIVVNGRRVPVPADVGLASDAESPLHVHEGEPGIVHVESTDPFWHATLGEFFDVWGVRLTSTCLGGYCDGDGRALTVFVNGVRRGGDPRLIPLADHQDVALVFGAPDEVPSPLPTFDWSKPV